MKKFDASKIINTILNFIVPLIALGASLAIGFIFLLPSIKNLPILEAEVEGKRNLEKQLLDKKERLNTLLDFKGIVDENSELVSRVLVSEAKVPELLTQVDIIGRESGLSVTTLSYSFSSGDLEMGIASEPTTAKAAEAPPGEGEEGLSEAPEEEIEIPVADYVNVTYGATGSYAQLVTFLDSLESSARIINVNTFRYSTDSDDDSQGYSFSFVLVSPYLFVGEDAVTDEVLSLDITGDSFLNTIKSIKELKVYDISVDSLIDIEGLEKSEEDNKEEEVAPVEPSGPPEDASIPQDVLDAMQL